MFLLYLHINETDSVFPPTELSKCVIPSSIICFLLFKDGVSAADVVVMTLMVNLETLNEVVITQVQELSHHISEHTEGNHEKYQSR